MGDRPRSSGRTRAADRPSSSCTASGCSRAAGSPGATSSRTTATRRSRRAGPTIRRRSPRRRRTLRPSRTKMVPQVTDHYLAAIARSTSAPAVIGHSFGGLIAQKIAGEGVAAVTVSIDNAPFKGVLPLPVSALKSAAPVLTNPGNRGKAVSLTFEQFNFGWANNLERRRGRATLDRHARPGSRGSRCSRRPSPTSTRSAARPRSTRRTRTADRC